MRIVIDTKYKGKGDDSFDINSLSEFDYSIEVEPGDGEVGTEVSKSMVFFARLIYFSCGMADNNPCAISTIHNYVSGRDERLTELGTVAALGAVLGQEDMIRYVESYNELSETDRVKNRAFLQGLIDKFQAEDFEIEVQDRDAITGEVSATEKVEFHPDSPEHIEPFEDFLNGLGSKGDD